MNILNFSNNLFSNDLGYKPNGAKRYLKASNDILEIEQKLANGLSVDDLSEEEYQKLNAFEKSESAAFLTKVNSEMSAAERIALKIAKGEKLTPEEERLISEKYPDLKKEAEDAKRQGDELKKRISQAKTPEEKQEIATTAVSQVSSMISKSSLPAISVQIKLTAIQKAISESSENSDITNHAFKNTTINKGSFINKEI